MVLFCSTLAEILCFMEHWQHTNIPCISFCRDMRRTGRSPVKTESEQSSVCQSPLKTCVDVKSERIHDSQEQHSTVDKTTLLSKSQKTVIITSIIWQRKFSEECWLSAPSADGTLLCFLRGSREGEDWTQGRSLRTLQCVRHGVRQWLSHRGKYVQDFISRSMLGGKPQSMLS